MLHRACYAQTFTQRPLHEPIDAITDERADAMLRQLRSSPSSDSIAFAAAPEIGRGVDERAVEIESNGSKALNRAGHLSPPTVRAIGLRSGCRARASFLRSSSRQIIGVKMSCMARSILPPGHTIVFARDMNAPCSIDKEIGEVDASRIGKADHEE